jgi:hypothetical protein
MTSGLFFATKNHQVLRSAIRPNSVQRSVYELSSTATHPPASSVALGVGATSSAVVPSSDVPAPPISRVASAGLNPGPAFPPVVPPVPPPAVLPVGIVG